MKFEKSKVEYLDHMGDDLAVVNAARVSFDRESEWLPSGSGNDYPGVVYREVKGRYVNLAQADARLLHYLARGMSATDLDDAIASVVDICELLAGPDPETMAREMREQLRKYRARPLHWSPFAHTSIKIRVTTSFAIARQLETHQVGLAANEVSRRYVDSEPTFLLIDEWRSRPTDRKQGSGSALHDPRLSEAAAEYRTACGLAAVSYFNLIDAGVAPEQARFVLPTSTMTTWIWTGSLYAFRSICRQRAQDDHAQPEVRDVAEQISAICAELFPVSWAALEAY
ncbi:alternative thymidylate synthase [Stappia sp. 22II-S9-Z10]|nr:alternative thymidylate synthase [Stappia sp. 22II-S9-Z10]